MKARRIIFLTFSITAIISALAIVQAASSTHDGVYTDAQAKQGETLYTNQCAMCHGAQLQGAGQNPALAGPAFVQNWSGQTVADLYTQIQTTMPAIKPGSLKPDEVSQVIAYILSANKYPAGKTELPNSVDALKAIQFDAPASGGQ